MTKLTITRSTVRRSLTSRADALRVINRILAGSITMKSLRESERNEIVENLRQTIEMLDGMAPHQAKIAALFLEWSKPGNDDSGGNPANGDSRTI